MRTKQLFWFLLFALLVFPKMVFADKFGKLFYTDYGSGNPLVLIHAFPTDQRLWKPQQDRLQHVFRVISVDLPGFGQSEMLAPGVSIADYSHEIKKLLDHLKLPKVIIGGESMGGYVALAFAKHYPNAVAGLVLSGTRATAATQVEKNKFRENANNVLANGPKNHVDMLMTKLLSEDVDATIRDYLATIVYSQNGSAMAAAMFAMADRDDTMDVLTRLNVPILIITGENDRVISTQESMAMHKVAAHSQLTILPRGGHLINLEQPEAWNAAVIKFFGNR